MKRVIVFMVLSALLVACYAQNRQMRLDNTLRDYEHAIRWGNYSDAYAFHKEHAKPPDFDYLQDIKVTAYEPLGRAAVSEEGNRIDQTVRIRYYHQDYVRERVVTDKQMWRYDDDNAVWLLDSEMPDFRSASP